MKVTRGRHSNMMDAFTVLLIILLKASQIWQETRHLALVDCLNFYDGLKSDDRICGR